MKNKKELSSRIDQLEAENAALRARLNRIEEAYKKYKPFFNASSAECDCEEELWQAIKTACEGEKLE